MTVELQRYSTIRGGYYFVPGRLIEGSVLPQMRLLGVLNSVGQPFYTEGYAKSRFGPPFFIQVRYNCPKDRKILERFFASATVAEFEELSPDLWPIQPSDSPPEDEGA